MTLNYDHEANRNYSLIVQKSWDKNKNSMGAMKTSSLRSGKSEKWDGWKSARCEKVLQGSGKIVERKALQNED